MDRRAAGSWFAALLLAALALVAGGAAAAPRTLVVNSNASDPAPRAAWQALVERFRAEHPDVDVQLNVFDHESYKKAIRNWLTGAPPDVVFWFAGNRMRQFVAPGLLADVSELYTPAVRAQLHPSALELVSAGGRAYGVPYTWYPVGLYYRRDLMDPPATWADLLATCERLRARGLEPIAIGTRDLWPAAAWFDYLDLRLNGQPFHLELAEGGVPWTDPRVRRVFARWKELLDRRCFTSHHASSSWQEAQALVHQGGSAFSLMGHYVVAQVPPELRERMAFAPFPRVVEGLPRDEEAPVNSLHVPARAKNRADALRFLAFVLRPDVQEALNRATLQIPVNLKAQPADDRFVREGQAHLASAARLAQYFDRDAREELAQQALNAFQEFMLHPERLDAILESLEQARRRLRR